jgi:hypothetical protein
MPSRARTKVPDAGGEGAHTTLATVLGYIQASVPIPRDSVGSDGLVADNAMRDEITRILETDLGLETHT